MCFNAAYEFLSTSRVKIHVHTADMLFTISLLDMQLV